jgi:hypothetical protein
MEQQILNAWYWTQCLILIFDVLSAIPNPMLALSRYMKS